MTKTTSSSLEQDLSDDYQHNGVDQNTRRLNGLENRLGKIEKKLDVVYDELGEHVLKPHPYQANPDDNTNERAALNTLAKAQNAAQRRTTPEGLLERGMRVLDDPTAVGVLQSYVNGGQLKKAADLVSAAEANAVKDGDDAALERVEGQMDEHSQLATISKLGEAVSDLQHTLSSLLSRIGKLETRPAAPAAPAQAVVKGAQFGRRQVQGTEYKDTPEGLMSRLEAVVDSPARVGHIASMIQGGEIEQARRIIEAAELKHEGDMKKRDRRGL